ncbi:hypothetical protein EDD15DRAFT_2202481 [Pisolithus albus]|nr:hypothetical protein EDD15DRAFT_2202481 [Pisolithus albus]
MAILPVAPALFGQTFPQSCPPGMPVQPQVVTGGRHAHTNLTHIATGHRKFPQSCPVEGMPTIFGQQFPQSCPVEGMPVQPLDMPTKLGQVFSQSCPVEGIPVQPLGMPTMFGTMTNKFKTSQKNGKNGGQTGKPSDEVEAPSNNLIWAQQLV